MKKFILKESELIDLIGKLVKEEMKETKKGKKDGKGPQCMPENVIPLDEIVGQSDMYDNYGVGITKRSTGVNSMVDTLAMLNNIRLLKDIKDGGTHLAYELMNNLNRFRNKNYYDETTGNCNKAMDKIIELYKEKESLDGHGSRRFSFQCFKDEFRQILFKRIDWEIHPSG